MKIPIFEYVLLRILRRYCFSTSFLEKFGQYLPFYKTNYNLYNPMSVVDRYEFFIKKNGLVLNLKNVLELGPGVTNSTAYELAARKCKMIYAYEPFAKKNSKADKKLLNLISETYSIEKNEITEKVQRIDSLDKIPEKSIDIVFSHSVLEHVSDPENLFDYIKSKITDHSIMVHIVDYRDHFFKYPYHMLMFKKKTWEKWLNPGDLPGWRLSDHAKILEKKGFSIEIDDLKRDPDNFNRIKSKISMDYNIEDEFLSVTQCVIIAKKK